MICGDILPDAERNLTNSLFQRAFCRAVVPIPVGSYAHTPADICWGIRDAYAYAHAAGYREVQVPHVGGEWEAWALE